MASYPNTPVLSKVKIGEQTYFLKDADARAIINTLGTAAYLNADTNITDAATGVAQTAAIKAYVDQAVAVGIELVVVETLPTASAQTKGKIYLVAHTHATGDVYDEFITIENPAGTFTWEKIGNTDIDLSGYVTDVKYENKTLKQQKNNGAYADVHTFGNMADANTASGTVAGETISGVKATGNVSGTAAITTTPANATLTKGDYTPAGSVELNAFTQTATAATLATDDYTPAGTVAISGTSNTAAQLLTSGNVKAGTAATFTEGTFTPNVPTALDLAKFNGGEKAPDQFDAGTLPSINYNAFNGGSCDVSYEDSGSVNFNEAQTKLVIDFEPGSFPTYTQGTDQFTAGTLPTKASDTFTANTPTAIDTTKFSGGSKAADTFTAGSLGAATKATFATEGIVASVGTGEDAETLIFRTATPGSAVTEQGTFTAPTFSEGAFTPAAIQTGFYTAGTAATFTEGTFTQGTLPTFEQGTDTYTGGAFPTIDQSETYVQITSMDLSLVAPTLSVDFQAATIDSATFFSQGTLPDFTEGEFDPAYFENGFYTAGSAASKAADSFTANAPTEVTLPTFSEVTVLTNATATFTGTTVEDALVTGVTYDKATANGATFTGTTAESALVTDVAYDKVDASATVTASNVELSVGDIAVASKSVTVTPDAQ